VDTYRRFTLNSPIRMLRHTADPVFIYMQYESFSGLVKISKLYHVKSNLPACGGIFSNVVKCCAHDNYGACSLVLMVPIVILINSAGH